MNSVIMNAASTHPRALLPSEPLKINTRPFGLYSQANSPISCTIATPPSPMRRRNNYASTEIAPGFSETKQFVSLLTSDRSRDVHLTVNGKIDKGFFIADQDFACYRRNYFQASGAFHAECIEDSMNVQLPVDVELILKSDTTDQYLPINRFFLGISSNVAGKEKEIDLVQHTSKRDKGPQAAPRRKLVRSGGTLLHEQMMASAQVSSTLSNQTIVAFERIQFKSATANNGKRRAAQQYYTVSLDLFAEVQEFANGPTKLIKVASTTSSPLVVRGRSPGHYADSEVSAHSPYGNFNPSVYGRLKAPNHSQSAHPFSSNLSFYGNQAPLSTMSLDAVSFTPLSADALQHTDSFTTQDHQDLKHRIDINYYSAEVDTTDMSSPVALSSMDSVYNLSFALNSTPSLFSTNSSISNFSPMNEENSLKTDDMMMQNFEDQSLYVFADERSISPY